MYVGGGRKQKPPGRYLPKIQVPSADYPDFGFRQLPSASAGIRGLPRTMDSHFPIYCWCADNNVCGRWAGSQCSWGNIYLKLNPPVLFVPILGSVSLRQPPSASVSFRGLWTTISTYIVGAKTTMYVGGGRKRRFLSRYIPKIEVFSASYPDFSFRQLPSASVSFCGLPSPHISLVCR